MPAATITAKPGWWGMMATVATEASFFSYLIFSYFYLGLLSRTAWPPPGPPDLRLVLPNTAILLLSSGTFWWAERGIRRGRQQRLRWGLALTLVLGVVFLLVQFAWEWPAQQFGPATDAYGSLFFTITGFHGAHLFVGLLMVTVILVRSWLGHFSEERHLAVSNVGLYWHFVDMVWLVVFSSLYLLPHLT